MAHAAEIDEDNIVVQVLVIPDDEEGNIQEFCAETLGLGGTWVQTSYNGTIRKNFAGPGFTYDQGRDAFIPPMPENATALDEETCRWIVPEPEQSL